MRCCCGFGDYRYAKVERGKLKCPYCQGEIVCEPLPASFCSPYDVYNVLAMRLRRRKQESFWVFLLDARNSPIGKFEVSKGTLTETQVHPREVFVKAITQHAASVILVHNHPSGDPTPSSQDIYLTTRLKEAGELLGIPVLDHIIVVERSYFSFREQGVPF